MARLFSLDLSLLRKNTFFRSLFLARMMSVFSLGVLNVAVPVQIHTLTGASFPVSLAIAFDGLGTFLGLLTGGVTADRYDRRSLILAARFLCGIGFLVLALNAILPHPFLVLIYIIAFWDGFFGGISMTALMAAFPSLVGESDMAAAGALSMLTTRLGAILAPLVGGLLIATQGVASNFLLAGLGTVATVIPLFRLPSLRPDPTESAAAASHPFKALADGLQFLMAHPLIAGVILIGTVQTMCSAIRAIFPRLAQALNAGPVTIGAMYAAIPAGAMLGALCGPSIANGRKPLGSLTTAAALCCLIVGTLGLLPHTALLLPALIAIGAAGSITALLQFTTVQRETPDNMRGRVSAVWSMQDVLSDSLGTIALGFLVTLSGLPHALFIFGTALTALSLATALRMRKNTLAT